MANKWRTTISEDNAVFLKYGINPSDSTTETLIRCWDGIDRGLAQSLITAGKSTATITDPKADGQSYSGTWTISDWGWEPINSGECAGSARIIQTLSTGTFNYLTPTNKTLVRARAYPLEQNEYSWMYYERFKNEEVTRWNNLTQTGLDDYQGYDAIRQIFTVDSFKSFVQTGADWSGSKYSRRRYLYCIVYADKVGQKIEFGSGLQYDDWSQVLTQGKYYTPTPLYSGGSWTFSQTWVEVVDPILRDVYYEQNKDGTYNLYRNLENTSDPAIKRTRTLQYAGLVTVKGYPMKDDATITLMGFNSLAEIIYVGARFVIGGDTYRVETEATCVAGEVTLTVTPTITQNTEDLADASTNQAQVFFNAL